MGNVDTIRAWKDEEYRDGLSDFERSRLPEHPAGVVELHDKELEAAAGGSITAYSIFFCYPVRTEGCKSRRTLCFTCK